MEKIYINDSKAVQLAIHVLDEGGIVMHPTETCYGFAVDIFNEKALSKLYHVKEMSDDKPVSILVDGLEMAQEYGIFSEKALGLAEKYWPGPLSILVPRKENLPGFFNRGSDFVSIRVSSLSFCEQMVKKFGQPVTTTSANKAGEPQLYQPESFGGVDLIVDGGAISKNRPSTVVKVDGDELTVIRQGDILCE